MDYSAFGAHGSEIVVASRHYGDNPVGGTILSLLSQNDDGSVSAKHAWTSSAEFVATQNHLLFSQVSREGYAAKTESIAAFPSTTSPDTSPRWEATILATPSPKTCVPKNTRTRCFASTCSACCYRPPNLQTATRWCFRTCFKTRSRPRARSCSSPSAAMRRNALGTMRKRFENRR